MTANPVWAELLQLLPVVTLAFPIVTSGVVDLASLGPAFAVAAVLAVGVTAAVAGTGRVLNPILLGTNLWLALGAVAFNVPVAPLAEAIASTQAFGLFVCAGLVGIVATAAAPVGYVGARGEPTQVRRASYVLLALTAVAIAWAWGFRADVRLGGGLPFIALNVARRVLISRG
jgi:hypothetical protein